MASRPTSITPSEPLLLGIREASPRKEREPQLSVSPAQVLRHRRRLALQAVEYVNADPPSRPLALAQQQRPAIDDPDDVDLLGTAPPGIDALLVPRRRPIDLA